MSDYLNIYTSYYVALNKIASELNEQLVEGIASKILEKNDNLSEEELSNKTRQVIAVNVLEDFYADAGDSTDDSSLLNKLGASIVGIVNHLFDGELHVKISTAKGKYDHINFKPPTSVADAAARGLELRRKAPKSHKGGLDPQQAKKQGIGSGVARAVSLKNRSKLSPGTISMMVRFFARHNKNIEKAKKLKGKDKAQSRAYQAALLWGGSPGRSWANKVFRQMEAADKKSKKHKKKK
jgi:hypothetical protein